MQLGWCQMRMASFGNPKMIVSRVGVLLAMLVCSGPAIVTDSAAYGQESSVDSQQEESDALWKRDNLVAWCIVPFDAARRGPVERAEMLRDLGIKRLAYDYRAEHIPTFDAEMEALKKYGIELTAWWFPGDINDEARLILDVLKRHGIKTQLWVTGGGEPTTTAEAQQERVAAEAERIGRIARAAEEIGCTVALYNHGGWFGEPENQIAIIEHLKLPNVGIVYNLHHGHDQLARLPDLLTKMRPHLLALNLNGMTAGGDRKGLKILPLGSGEYDLAILEAIEASGYRGPIGILNHTDLDARARLRDNLVGLEWLTEVMESDEAELPPRPKYESWEQPIADPVPGKSLDEIELVAASIAHEAVERGSAVDGLTLFASQKLACLSCHQVQGVGGRVGPAFDTIGQQRSPWELVESILQPQRRVDPAYATVRVLTTSGRVWTGYVEREDEKELVLRDASSGEKRTLPQEEIELLDPAGSVMPSGLHEAMSHQQLLDIVAFLMDLGKGERFPTNRLGEVLGHFVQSEPAKFDIQAAPLDPENWTTLHEDVNRDRLFQFYTKQALHFQKMDLRPPLLAPFPGLDGGGFGHWGNQNEAGWADARWNDTVLSSVQCGVFRGGSLQVTRGVCVRLGGGQQFATCFNPDTLSYDAVWKGGFLKFSSVRHGFMDGVLMDGELVAEKVTPPVNEPRQYLGFYRVGKQVVFAYRIGAVEYLDSPGIENGKFVRQMLPRQQHPLNKLIGKADQQWPEVVTTAIRLGKQRPYAIDTIEIPKENPWKALIFASGHDFLPNGDAVVCTMQGDVWRVSGLDSADPSAGIEGQAQWRRIAAGLHQPLGLMVEGNDIYVIGRDRLSKLVDLNNDGEIDFYHSYCDRFETSPSGHDFICGLQRDAAGNFYTASGNQGLVQISADGQRVSVVASGFRNPDGLGIYPDGIVTVPCSEGEWTPASMICAVDPKGEALHYGYRGPKDGQPPALPMVYLPRGVDNSSGGQIYVDSDRWGPLQGTVVHTSFGAGTYMLLLRDEVNGQVQGATVPMEGDFLSGAHRARFRDTDGQLYVSGMAGWGSYTTDDGCFQRVRYVGGEVQQPIGFHVHSNGIHIEFSSVIDPAIASDARQHFAQQWNYRYSSAYGSPEYSARHAGIRGHDVVSIRSAHVGADGKSLFLEIPDLQPVNQLHLNVAVAGDERRDLLMTVHALDEPFENFSGYRPDRKIIYPHPILADLALAVNAVPNPYQQAIEGARQVTVRTAGNLSFETREFEVKAGEAIQLTLVNPDVVPHNWALLKPGSEKAVGELANSLVADPEGAARQYIPDTDDVLAFTDVVEPGKEFSIYFRAPQQPGSYPFMCTFPGHWMIMQGTMIVR